MKIFIFGELNSTSIKLLCPNATILDEAYSLSGFCACYSEQGRAFLCEGDACVKGALIECSESEAWAISQWKNVFLINFAPVGIDDIYSYFGIYESSSTLKMASEEDIGAFGAFVRSNTSLKMADLHLLIPGYFTKKELPCASNCAHWGAMLEECIQGSAEGEFNSDFLKDTSRIAVGDIEIILENPDDDSLFFQNATLALMRHNVTGLCVLDIYIPACIGNAHRTLCAYCGNFLRLKMNGQELSIDELCNELGIEQHGSRRSMVFSYEKLSEELLLNILVNEERPMGKIMSSHFKEIISNNVAQYDTAEVFVSEATMIEITDNVVLELPKRIESQAIEIFFVEMLLLEDASVSRMYSRVKDAIIEEQKNEYNKHTEDILTDIIDDSSYSMFFADYQQFYFPTVRISAWKIAKAFGIDSIREKYDKSKQILSDMIDRHNTNLAKREDRIENLLLLFLAVLSGVEPLQMGISLIIESSLWSYIISIALLIGLGAIFILIRRATRFRMKKEAKKKRKGIERKNNE